EAARHRSAHRLTRAGELAGKGGQRVSPRQVLLGLVCDLAYSRWPCKRRIDAARTRIRGASPARAGSVARADNASVLGGCFSVSYATWLVRDGRVRGGLTQRGGGVRAAVRGAEVGAQGRSRA